VVLLDDDDKIGDGSRRDLLSKRSLEVWDRLGVGTRMVEKGVSGTSAGLSRRYHGLSIRLRRKTATRCRRSSTCSNITPRRICRSGAGIARNRSALAQQGDLVSSSINDHAALTIDTPDGPYRLRAEYVVACDGARSALRAWWAPISPAKYSRINS